MIKLRRATILDLPRIMKAENTKGNKEFVLQNTELEHQENLASEDIDYFVFYNSASPKIVGYCILAGKTSLHRSIELRRIVITEKSKSYGEQSMVLIIQYCFEELKTHRLCLDVFAENHIAIGLYKKLDFVLEALLRESYFKNGLYQSQILMSMLKSEYFRKKNRKDDKSLI